MNNLTLLKSIDVCESLFLFYSFSICFVAKLNRVFLPKKDPVYNPVLKLFDFNFNLTYVGGLFELFSEKKKNVFKFIKFSFFFSTKNFSGLRWSSLERTISVVNLSQ